MEHRIRRNIWIGFILVFNCMVFTVLNLWWYSKTADTFHLVVGIAGIPVSLYGAFGIKACYDILGMYSNKERRGRG